MKIWKVNKIFRKSLEIFFVMLGLLEHGNNILDRNWNLLPTHITNLAVNLYDDMRYYNVMSRISGQDVVQMVI